MRKSARLRPLIRPFVLAAATLLLLASGAGAASTPKLVNQITDQAGVLGSGQSQVQTALDNLQSGANVQLWLLTVSTTGSTSAPDFAQTTFEANGLGGNDMLLVIAANDHRYGWWEIDATGLPTNQIDALVSSRMDSLLKSGNYAGAVASFANGLGDAVIAAKAPAPVTKPTAATATAAPATTNTGSGSSDSGSSVLWLLIGVILVGGGLIFVYLWMVSRRGNHLSGDERDKRTGDLARQANQMLLATDDALHEAGQDLGFAQAEFSDEDTAPYAAAIAAAQDELKLAFTVRQKLDDSIPEDQPTRERMYGEIIAHCTAAKTAVDAQAKRLSELRDLEKSAPQALAALPQAIAALQAREPAITTAQKTLAEYAPSSWASVKGNAEEADKRGHFAEQQVAAGNASLAATPPNANAAAHAARAAQEAVAQANQLLDAMEQQAAALKKAGASLADEIAAVEAELAAANKTAQAATGGTSGAGAAADAGAADLAKAQTLLQAAKNQAGADSPDTIAALKAVQTARASADTALSGIRDSSAAAARATATFDAMHASAQSSISQATDFIAARRNGVGTQARTRLAEAQRHLAQAEALAPNDLTAATTEASTAGSMAEQAYSLASSDFTGFDGRGGGGGGANIGTSIMGGIIGGMLSGGGRRGGGVGGSPWGSGGGWTGGGGSGGFGGFGGFGGGGGGHGGGGSFGGGGGGGHGGGGGW